MRLVRSLGVFVVSVLAFVGCGESEFKPGVSSNQKRSPATVVGAVTVELASALPACSYSRRGSVYYVESERQLYYCDGRRYRRLPLPTQAGPRSLCSVEPAAPTACAGGGVAISTGLDQDGDGSLDPAEVAHVEHVCDGEDGSSCSVSTDSQGVKTIHCTDGTSAVISDGEDGEDGVNWVVSVEPAPASSCPSGGSTISAGPDGDGDGAPDSVQSSQVVCNGQAGPPGPPGINGSSAALRLTRFATHAECPAGGVLAEAGIDANANSVLDDDEVQSGEVICDGEDALLERIRLIEPGALCEFGGERRERGLDANGNGSLEDLEVVPELSVLECFVPSTNVGGAVLGTGGATVRGNDLDSPSPRLVRYTLDFLDGIDAEQLSPSAREALTSPATMMSLRVAYAIDLLGACCGADVVSLDAEIDYRTNGAEHTDLIVEIQGQKAAVDVISANIPFGGVTPGYADVLWPQVLASAEAAQANLSAADAVEKSILVMFVSGADAAAILDTAYQALSAATRADTIAILVQTVGNDAEF